MKTKLNLIVAIMFLGMASLFAQDVKKEEFKVYGNCGMCEKRIEKAAKSLDGVSKAKWDSETKMMEVTFDESKVKIEDIHKAIADVGHDTDKAKADDKVYSELHSCCKYDRKSEDK